MNAILKALKWATPGLILVFLMTHEAVSQNDSPKIPESKVTELLDSLGSPDVAERTRAERALLEMGPGAERFLRAALKAKDDEVKLRVMRILAQFDTARKFEELRRFTKPGLLYVTAISPNDAPLHIERIDLRREKASRLFSTNTAAIMRLKWSPMGDRAAFVQYSNGIKVLSRDGKMVKQVTSQNVPDPGTDLSWSPSGERLAFTSTQGPGPGGTTVISARPDLYVVTVHSGEVTQLTGEKRSAYPSWSPDGQFIVYVAARVKPEFEGDLYLVRPSGGAPIRLTHDRRLKRDPSWSPDGESIAFAWDGGGNGLGIIDVATKKVKVLDSGDGSRMQPAWSPDGKQLVYLQGPTGVEGTRLLSIDIDGKNKRMLLAGEGGKLFPCWSPNGKWVAIQWNAPATWQVYVMDADGANLKQITHAKGGAFSPEWALLK